MIHKPTLGVFGLGQFMIFFIPHLREHFEIKVYDRDGGNNKNRNESIHSLQVMPANMQETAECDFVMLGYPAKYIPELCQNISKYIKKNTTVFDICSVKTPPVNAMCEYLPKECHIIATHPIFGPQSGKNGIKNLKCAFSNVSCEQNKYNFLKSIFEEKLGLQIFEMTPENHDKEMAYIQGITHFIGRSLKKLNIPDSDLATCSYLDLRKSSETVGYDSDELFLSIQNDNPYAGEIRENLISEFQKQNDFIKNNQN